MATREYSAGERDELLQALREAFEEYYIQSEIKHLSLGRTKRELGSDFFRKLDSDSNKKNVEEEFTISRSTLESFFKDEERTTFSDKNSIKINALINFYSQNIFDTETKEALPKEGSTLNESSILSDSEDLYTQPNKIETALNIEGNSFFKKYRTLMAYFLSALALPLLLVVIIVLNNDNNIMFFSFFLFLTWLVSTVVTVYGFTITKKRVKKGKVSAVRYTIFSIGLLMSVAYIVYAYLGTRFIFDEFGGQTETYYGKAFVEDPARLGYGNTSINFTVNGSNDTDELDLNYLKGVDSISFYVFVDYQNATNETLEDARVIVNYVEKGVSKSTKITGELTSLKGGSVTDQTKLINLPDKWKLQLLDAWCSNTHPHEYCPNYAYDLPLNISELTGPHGALLPILDTYGESSANHYTGACSQGHVIAQFRLSKQ
ncbi:MAG: hypothetical protein ACK5M1_04680 [Xanthomarina gelatinilytica]|uniref:hypothetical protein n=1 Tax=Xanthomarina gelatinilytica TaxID=1137281 RepID=UPI003A890EDD